MDYRERCSIMEACIPASEFKHQVVKLHVDMLNEIESLRAKLAEAEKGADTEIKNIGALIYTQDNRITDQPIFVVEKSVMVITDPDYGYDAEEWINTKGGDYEKASETKAARLDSLYNCYRDTGGWKKFYLKEVWEFVTACFTEKGCEDYLAANGHNIGKTRIYAYGSYRNREFQTIRNYLMEQAAIAKQKEESK